MTRITTLSLLTAIALVCPSTSAGAEESREKKIPKSDATSAWGYYGITPESPDGKRLCYAVYPEPMDLDRKEKYPVYQAE